MSAPVFICANAFGPTFVKHHGHATAANLAARAGAAGLEVRQELMTKADYPLDSLTQVFNQLDLECTFSAKAHVWNYEHCDVEGLLGALDIAETLGARLLKVGIGALPTDPSLSKSELLTVAARLKDSRVHLVIENDQTPEGGDIKVMETALALLADAGIEAGLTFDTGNWYWVGENPIDAARQLGSRVDYVHCKSIDLVNDQPRVCQPRAPHLAAWSTLWTAFKPNTLRSIEFPLAQEDSVDLNHNALIATAHEFITRLSHY